MISIPAWISPIARYAHLARDSVRESPERIAVSIADDILLTQMPMRYVSRPDSVALHATAAEIDRCPLTLPIISRLPGAGDDPVLFGVEY